MIYCGYRHALRIVEKNNIVEYKLTAWPYFISASYFFKLNKSVIRITWKKKFYCEGLSETSGEENVENSTDTDEIETNYDMSDMYSDIE